MTRLSVLMGIGLMLVGAVAYALPQEQEIWALLPAMAGIIMSTGGIVAMHCDKTRKHLMHVNALAALFLLVYASSRVVADAMIFKKNTIPLIADLDVLGLSAVFLYFSIKSFVETRVLKKAQQNEESLP